MRSGKPAIGFTLGLVLAAAMLIPGARAAAQTETILYSFQGQTGTDPFSTLTWDAAGNLFGTAFAGGLYGQGMVFELSPAGGGTWAEKVLYSFNPNRSDGTNPEASVVLDAAGNLYGTTVYGGASGGGTAFKLAPRSSGGWSETVLHSFSVNEVGGYQPSGSLIFDADGNLYGTTSGQGANGAGAVFELKPQVGGGWYESVIHPFINNGRDGFTSYAGLISDGSGGFIGTTCGGGVYRGGTVFQITRTGTTWTERTLFSFQGKLNHHSDGSCPQAAVIRDASGNLYGTTLFGGPGNNFGIVYELSPRAGGGWTEKILHDFNNDGVDGYQPSGGFALDSAGNLYGMTHNGGANNHGAAYELTPSASGWTEKILHNFNNDGVDGSEPLGGFVLDASGNLFGTTSGGGTRGGGTVFEITP